MATPAVPEANLRNENDYTIAQENRELGAVYRGNTHGVEVAMGSKRGEHTQGARMPLQIGDLSQEDGMIAGSVFDDGVKVYLKDCLSSSSE